MIKVENLVKTFGTKVAVNGISFEVQRGEVLGFLGPNGAGKSTTMRMVTGFIPPTSGKVSVGGNSIDEAPLAAKKLIGYLPENAPSYSEMTVGGFLKFAAEIRGLAGDARDKAVRRAVEMCFLEPVVHQAIETLSKGYRHRTCFAQSIIHDPEVLILDEPTDGLDPNQKHEVRGLIRRMGEKKAIIFSTHILEEVDAACSRAIIIDRGQIVANGTPAELRMRADGAGAVVLRVLGQETATVRDRISSLGGVRKVLVLGEEGAGVAFRVFAEQRTQGRALAAALGDLCASAGWRLEELHVEEGRLDDVFRAITMPDTKREEKN